MSLASLAAPRAPLQQADAPAGGAAGRTVMCAKLKKQLPGLDKKPYPNELGRRIYDEISADAWKMWKEHAKILLNEYRLNLAYPEATAFLYEQCEAFLFGQSAKLPEQFTAPTAQSR